jgi:hypothetical protein
VNALIGRNQDIKELKLSFSERQEILRLAEENTLGDVYQYIIERMNEYELSLVEGKFFSVMFEEEMSFNHVVCLMRNDVTEHCKIDVSPGLASKLVKLFLKALVECCEEDGVVELDAQDVLKRSAYLGRGMVAGT